MYIKRSLPIQTTTCNEYGIHVKIILPNSQRMNIVTIYLPPTSSLKKRNITEETATKQAEDIMDQTQPQLTTLVCGDFNARIGTRTPILEDMHPKRTVEDHHICARATGSLTFVVNTSYIS
jgi:Endonuclease/Exonuclease/phosphatase family.